MGIEGLPRLKMARISDWEDLITPSLTIVTPGDGFAALIRSGISVELDDEYKAVINGIGGREFNFEVRHSPCRLNHLIKHFFRLPESEALAWSQV